MAINESIAIMETKKQWFETLWENWRQDLTEWMRHDALKLVGILVVAYLLLRILRALTNRLEGMNGAQDGLAGLRAKQTRTLAGVISRAGRAVILFVALLEALPLFGVDIKPLLASAGIIGLAVGFGAQTVVKDMINGFFILLENQYDLGDVVRVAGVSGTVEELSLRRTILRDANGAVHVVPNGEIRVASNLTREWSQATLTIVVDVREPSERVFQLLREAGDELFAEAEYRPMMLAAPEVVGLDRILGRDAEYLVLSRTKPGQQWVVGRELRRRIKELFLKNGVALPQPMRMGGESAESGGASKA